MLPYTELANYLTTLDYEVIRNSKKECLINLPCAFDIETTSYISPSDEKMAFMYIWQLGIGHNSPVFYGRNWSEFIECLELIKNHFNLSDNTRMIIYVHNLSYEFQFMRKLFTWTDVFSIEERKPLKAITSLGIEFRCSYILSGYSLANTARNLVKYKVDKLIGDLDYKLIRHHNTTLTEKELAYCENDIIIILNYIQEQIEHYNGIDKIPLTNTGRVRKFVKDNCYYSHKSHKKTSKGKYIKYRKIMSDLILSSDVYAILKRAFIGGFTHANSNYVGAVLNDVTSIDFTSSYPSVMLAEKYPMSEFKPLEIESIEHLYECAEKFCLVFDIKFYNIKPKIYNEVYISESKTFKLINPIIDNGRVYSADLLGTTITNVDLDIIKEVYEWGKIEIGKCYFAYKNYLPKAIIESVLALYEDKTTLKDVVGYEVEYLLSKGMLNSVYGMSVTDIVKDTATYTNNEWGVEKVDLDEEIKSYNASKNRFLFYPWGLWVTAYARRNLWTGILAVGDDYIYSDTDSIKLLNYSEHEAYINWFNGNITNKMLKMCKYHKINPELLAPKTNDDKIKPLGIWDFDGFYTKFKTLGAKRYMYVMNDRLNITVAGLSKQEGVEYLLEQGGGIDGAFNLFNDNLYIPANQTGKNTHTYLDNEQVETVQDYKGECAIIETLSGVHLQECEFTLSLSNQFKTFLNNISNGYLLTGTKYE